jgi:hypothetical protein
MAKVAAEIVYVALRQVIESFTGKDGHQQASS